ncbi:hypothetical protein C0995_005343, partial [Termitomyces sp. Mi166
GHPEFLDDQCIQDQLKAGINDDFDCCADEEGIYKEADLKKFVDALDVCDQKRQQELKRIREKTNDLIRKRQALTSFHEGTMPVAKKSGGSAANSGVADKINGGAKHTPRLTDLEREYLKMMKECCNC